MELLGKKIRDFAILTEAALYTRIPPCLLSLVKARNISSFLFYRCASYEQYSILIDVGTMINMTESWFMQVTHSNFEAMHSIFKSCLTSCRSNPIQLCLSATQEISFKFENNPGTRAADEKCVFKWKIPGKFIANLFHTRKGFKNMHAAPDSCITVQQSSPTLSL